MPIQQLQKEVDEDHVTNVRVVRGQGVRDWDAHAEISDKLKLWVNGSDARKTDWRRGRATPASVVASNLD